MGLLPVSDTRPRFTALPRVHDLPVSWDGRAVTWGPWHDSTQPTHLPEQVCERCGVLGPQRHAFGRRAPAAGEDQAIDLMAERCPACDSDSVTDMVSHQAWLLDAEDYGPDGSTPPDTLW